MKGLGGDFQAFWPDGIHEAPYDLVLTVNHSLRVISWFENLPRDEQPPRHIWWSEKLLDRWFENVEQERGKSSGSKKPTSYEQGTEVPLMENELAADMRPR